MIRCVGVCVKREGKLHVSSYVMHICDTFSDACMWYIKQPFYTRAYLKFLPAESGRVS